MAEVPTQPQSTPKGTNWKEIIQIVLAILSVFWILLIIFIFSKVVICFDACNRQSLTTTAPFGLLLTFIPIIYLSILIGGIFQDKKFARVISVFLILVVYIILISFLHIIR